MTKRTIFFATLIFASGAVNAQSANKQSQTTTARQTVPLATTAQIGASGADNNTVTANASVNSVGVNVAAPALTLQERPAPPGSDIKKPVEGKNVSENKINDRQK